MNEKIVAKELIRVAKQLVAGNDPIEKYEGRVRGHIQMAKEIEKEIIYCRKLYQNFQPRGISGEYDSRILLREIQETKKQIQRDWKSVFESSEEAKKKGKSILQCLDYLERKIDALVFMLQNASKEQENIQNSVKNITDFLNQALDLKLNLISLDSFN